MTLPIRPTIRLNSPGDMAIALPMLLGYHPEESLVVSCLKGAAVDLTMRFDLDGLPPADVFAVELADRVRLAAADVTFVAVFTDELPDALGLPHGTLVEALYADSRLRVIEAVLVSRGRWWSYLCPDEVCCPPTGTALSASSAVATSLTAAFALSGAGVLAGRSDLERSIGCDPDLDHVAAGRRLTAAWDRVAGMNPTLRLDEVRRLVDLLVTRFGDPRAGISEDEAALLAALLHDVMARDEVLVQAVPPRRREGVLRVLRAVVRQVPPPHDAPVCTALAWFAYADGDGTTANIALDRALESDPDYSLALLVEASLERQLPPAALVEVMEGATRDAEWRAGHDFDEEDAAG